MTFKITKKGSNNFWHTYNNNSKVVNLSDFEVVLDYASQTFSISMPNGANVPNIAVAVADIIVLDETGANVNEIFANVEALRVKLVALGYTPYVVSSSGGIQSIQEGANITVDNTDPLNPIVSATGGGSQNLQQVTDVGNQTTNDIKANSFQVYDVVNGVWNKLEGVESGWKITDDTGKNITTGQANSLAIGDISDNSQAVINTLLLTDNRNYQLPDSDGTIALTTDVTNKVPYTGATEDVNLGEFGLLTGNIEFDNTPTNIPTTAGSMVWNDTDGTLDLKLKGGNVTLQIGQESVIRVVNKTATNVNLLEANYQAVRVTGAQGQRLKVDLAQATNDLLSAETIGLVTETINNNEEGFITTSGLIRNINTTGSLQSETWTDGDILYLSPTVAGQVTKVKPVAPNHLVIIGYVVSAHATQGSIFIKVDNGYELDELHNVLIDTPLEKDVLQYEASTSLWKNKQLDFSTLQPYAVASFVSEITFDVPKIFFNFLAPTSATLTSNLTGAKKGVVQKIYVNHATNPVTSLSGWVNIGSGTYTPSVANIIYAEWTDGSRVEYWIVTA